MAGRLLMIKFIKMKKKIIFAVATGFFAVATVFNMNLLQGNSAGDVSLDAIAVMAKAQSEGGGDKNNSNWGGLFHYPEKGGDPKKCTLWAKYDGSGNVVSTSTSKITVTAGFTVSKVTGAEDYCPNEGDGCTVYSCRITDN